MFPNQLVIPNEQKANYKSRKRCNDGSVSAMEGIGSYSKNMRVLRRLAKRGWRSFIRMETANDAHRFGSQTTSHRTEDPNAHPVESAQSRRRTTLGLFRPPFKFLGQGAMKSCRPLKGLPAHDDQPNKGPQP